MLKTPPTTLLPPNSLSQHSTLSQILVFFFFPMAPIQTTPTKHTTVFIATTPTGCSAPDFKDPFSGSPLYPFQGDIQTALTYSKQQLADKKLNMVADLDSLTHYLNQHPTFTCYPNASPLHQGMSSRIPLWQHS